jgi:hypothetical protein
MPSSNGHAVLLLDNAPVHNCQELDDIMREHNFEILFFPPNATHLLQVLDVGVFGILKYMYLNSTSSNFALNDHLSLKINHICECYRRATSRMILSSAWSSAHINCFVDATGNVRKIGINVTTLNDLLFSLRGGLEAVQNISLLTDPLSET